MLKTLYLFKYNNYYNRIVKKEDNLDGYLPYQIGSAIQGVNFIPNDYVNTEHVINWSEALQKPDYLIVSNDGFDIDSRWFIIDSVRTRNGQYKLTLRRDLVVDFYNDVVNASCFIEKGILSDNDPMIFNKEDMTFNQIKKEEILLKDNTQTPWLVGYISRDKQISGNAAPVSIADFTVNSLDDWEWKYYITRYKDGVMQNDNLFIYNLNFNNISKFLNFRYSITYKNNKSIAYEITSSDSTITSSAYSGKLYLDLISNVDFYDNHITTAVEVATSNILDTLNSTESLKVLQGQNTGINPDYDPDDPNSDPGNPRPSNFKDFYISGVDSNTITGFRNLQGKIIYVSSENKFYSINFRNRNNQNISFSLMSPALQQVFAESKYFGSDPSEGTWGWFNTNYPSGENRSQGFTASLSNAAAYTIDLTEVYNESYVYDFTAREHVKDAPYDIFCIPYLNTFKFTTTSGSTITSNPEAAYTVAMDIASKFSGGQQGLYDLQLLPYCPFESFASVDTDGKGLINLSSLNEDNYSYIKNSSGSTVSIVLFPNISSWSFIIQQELTYDNKKIDNQTKKWRLMSPNSSAAFDFNVAMNDGVDFFQIDCTYLPYSPYIHVAPNFKSLYGELYFSDSKSDMRGLICQGDFSLAYTSDAWETYKNLNKNYENIFNRQIENMEVQQDVERTRQKFSIATGIFSGAAGGATTGAMAGGAYGAIAGALIGGATSTIGGVMDYNLSEILRNEAIDYTKDQFGYQLGNIKARSDTLAKSTSYTYNNRYFVFIEIYDCTNEEKEAFKNKIKYNGMTIMRIGTINELLGNRFDNEPRRYFKGQLIRLEDIVDDYHLLNNLAAEIYKGVFFE